MKHPNTRLRLQTDSRETILYDYVRTWKEYHKVLRRYREFMEESPTSLNITVEEV